MITYFDGFWDAKKGEQDRQNTAGETKTNSQVMFFYWPLHMDVPVLAEHIISMQTQDVVWKQWMIKMVSEIESRKSVLSARLDDD